MKYLSLNSNSYLCYLLKSVATVCKDMKHSWHCKEKKKAETIDECDDKLDMTTWQVHHPQHSCQTWQHPQLRPHTHTQQPLINTSQQLTYIWDHTHTHTAASHQHSTPTAETTYTHTQQPLINIQHPQLRPHTHTHSSLSSTPHSN